MRRGTRRRSRSIGPSFAMLFDGDSISSSYAGHTILANPTWGASNVAVSGSSINNVTATLNLANAARVAALDGALASHIARNRNIKHCTAILIGHNDFGTDGDSTGTFLAQLSAYLDARRAAGHVIALWPMSPTTVTGGNAWRNTVNAEIATWAGVHADYVIDTSALTGWLDADASNTDYWADGIHPTVAECQIMAAAVKAQAFDLAAA